MKSERSASRQLPHWPRANRADTIAQRQAHSARYRTGKPNIMVCYRGLSRQTFWAVFKNVSLDTWCCRSAWSGHSQSILVDYQLDDAGEVHEEGRRR